MNISQRLRTCARHTGLDAVIELLNEAADEIDAMQARSQATHPAEVTDDFESWFAERYPNREDRQSEFRMTSVRDLMFEAWQIAFGVGCVHGQARSILALRPVQMNAFAGCNCRWDGDTQVQWCELHLAHKEAIHEWAERAKEAEKKLALRPAAAPMTDEVFDLICNAIDKADTISMEGDYMLDSDDCIAVVRVMQALLSAHHGITAQVKKETP